MAEHKHASVLRAIADGVPLSEFEGRWRGVGWYSVENLDWFWEPDLWEIRRKPQYITVNGFKVPKPIDTSATPNSLPTVFWPYVTYDSLWDSAMPQNREAQLAVQRGCGHVTAEAAIAHAKAMLGIDPEAQ